MEVLAGFLAILATCLLLFSVIATFTIYFEAKNDGCRNSYGYTTYYDNQYGLYLGWVYEQGYKAGETAKKKLSKKERNKLRFNR